MAHKKGKRSAQQRRAAKVQARQERLADDEARRERHARLVVERAGDLRYVQQELTPDGGRVIGWDRRTPGTKTSLMEMPSRIWWRC